MGTLYVLTEIRHVFFFAFIFYFYFGNNVTENSENLTLPANNYIGPTKCKFMWNLTAPTHLMFFGTGMVQCGRTINE